MTMNSLLVIGFICAFSIMARLAVSQVITTRNEADTEKMIN